MMLNDMIRAVLDIRDELADGASHRDTAGADLAQALADHLWSRTRGDAPAPAAVQPTAPAAQPAPQAAATAPAQQPASAEPDNPFAGM